VWDVGCEIIVDTAKVGAKGSSLLEAPFDERLGVIVKALETAEWEITDNFQGSVEDSVYVRGKHMGFRFVKFRHLGNKVEVLERGLGQEFRAVQVSIPKKPEFVCKGVDLVDNAFDR
jgi:hypothetical protein